MTTLATSPDLAIRSAADRSSLLAPLVDRLAARISAARDEIAIFPSPQSAFESLVAGLAVGRAATIALPVPVRAALPLQRVARSVREVGPSGTSPAAVESIIASARDSEVLLLANPVLDRDGGVAAPELSPRSLLQIRSRATRPLILLDLVDEEYARTPLTQPALLLPGTLLVRGFGEPWLRAGATTVAGLAFVAGPRDLVARLSDAPLASDEDAEAALIRAACSELDEPNIDRRVRALARS